ncbi:MAG: UvrD-helicase domain-containing protein, partial [Spirochaetales bacterium]|nr:UvrD-helicase domain-containing protein [Spirochaetales bacterium]
MKELDKNQKLAVECDKNAVVSAGAGAGKTTVLSERYLRLISEGKAGVENILTLTFTRKAATEMNER